MKQYTVTTTLIMLLLILLVPFLLHAQPTDFEDDVIDTPIDGGLSLLVAAGIGYGAKKLKAINKQSAKN